MHGCSIMPDGWTDREKLFELLDSLVDEIGEEHVVQVVTDNGSNHVATGKMLMEKRRHLYWTSCAAHCIGLMLEDIGKIPLVKNTIRRDVALVGYIYSHTFTLSLLRSFTKKKELMRPAITRFATSFLSLERIHKQKDNLRKMFTCDEWVQNKLSKDAKEREATKTVMMPSFWRHVVFILKVMAPLVRVLRLVDSEKKPAMGYIYEAMETAKETIMKSFSNNEQRYANIFKIIDDRWNYQLHRPLHAAGHILNPDIFYENKRLEFDREVTNRFI
ncbi:uncharacterized protein LOC121774667 [Salvia splendens]|uniref:uncharacterized protein LOC121774667 n=1 Tax=Salvia splendens TaxID=180675 RepID=UPI001C27E2DF|nr:uncharacterized protein LOC121774667 [Salvia splendens]